MTEMDRSTNRVAPSYGRNLLGEIPPGLLERPIVVIRPEPWPLVAGYFDEENTQLCMPERMERSDVEKRSESFSDASAVFGIGGGAALDQAKHAAWKKGLPLVLMPSILSTDAAYTPAVAVRDQGRVRYIGQVLPEHLLVDFGLLQSAPSVYNHSGVGDILSIFTALWDWKQAADRGEDGYSEDIAARAGGLLERLYKAAADLRMVTDKGLELLSELLREEVKLCEEAGSSRPEEGSEHHLAYCIEAQTGKNFLHGRLVCLCVKLVADYQGQDTRQVYEFLRDLTLDCCPAAVGVTREELLRALVGMKEFVEQEEQLLPGAFHFFGGVSRSDARALVQAIR